MCKEKENIRFKLNRAFICFGYCERDIECTVKYCATHIECMGCQISKEDDEKRSDPQSNTENTTETKTMANKATAVADKSRLERKLCLVRDNFFFNSNFSLLRLIIVKR